MPDLAKLYQVARQHVQATANALHEKKLLVTAANPRHKRSRLISLSPLGRKTFGAILKRDAAAIEELLAHIPKKNAGVTRKTLQAILEGLAQ